MSLPGSTVYTLPSVINPPPAGVTTQHVRATVTGAANFLSTFLPGGACPQGSAFPNQRPIAVTLQLEAPSAGSKVYMTMDGLTTPSATVGFEVPSAPGSIRVPTPHLLAADALVQIQLFCAGTAYVQCFFEY